MTKPLRVWLAPPGPNPWKVILVLEELNVPYEIEAIRFEDIKKRPFIDINPNGRVPAIQDPNTGLTLWESGAIVQYLIKQYDLESRLSYNSFREQELCNQWIMFQVSGQGPYYGQKTWFTYLHPEKIPSAIERYGNEVNRVLGVLEGVLSAKPAASQFLVGDRITYADMSFVPWNDRLDATMGVPDDQKFAGFPHVNSWHEAMVKRPAWKKAMEIRAKVMDEQGLDWNGMPKGTKSFQEYEAGIAATESTASK